MPKNIKQFFSEPAWHPSALSSHLVVAIIAAPIGGFIATVFSIVTTSWLTSFVVGASVGVLAGVVSMVRRNRALLRRPPQTASITPRVAGTISEKLRNRVQILWRSLKLSNALGAAGISAGILAGTLAGGVLLADGLLAQPTVVMSKGGLGPTSVPEGAGIPCALSASTCRYLTVELRNFEPGRYEVSCEHDGWRSYGSGSWATFSLTVGSDGTARQAGPCFINFADLTGRGAFVRVGSYLSNYVR